MEETEEMQKQKRGGTNMKNEEVRKGEVSIDGES